jgi:hypothetical protein
LFGTSAFHVAVATGFNDVPSCITASIPPHNEVLGGTLDPVYLLRQKMVLFSNLSDL